MINSIKNKSTVFKTSMANKFKIIVSALYLLYNKIIFG
ncbi:hypothetical protein BVAVS116_E0053 (plasmid) [Borreliella valaisiana VS116]|uniref:Uncharacterized protein n=1 Tax=Borreliella valaisiana VS116 TaxID=445987 RepID=C0R8T4_BORVA|nr:hypothetical protein BVAVS116_E0053 [Borreliella valaisiana VS116]